MPGSRKNSRRWFGPLRRMRREAGREAQARRLTRRGQRHASRAAGTKGPTSPRTKPVARESKSRCNSGRQSCNQQHTGGSTHMNDVASLLGQLWPSGIPAADFPFLVQLVDRLRGGAAPARGPSSLPPPPSGRRKRKGAALTETQQLILVALEDEANDVTAEHLAKKAGISGSIARLSLCRLAAQNRVTRRRAPRPAGSGKGAAPFLYSRIKPPRPGG
jgi:hypothetical protein